MSSILRVDSIQTAAGGSATASGLGIGGTGKIGQVITSTVTTSTSSTSTSYVDVSGFSMNITPTSSSSKIYLSWNILNGADNHSTHQGVAQLKILRDSTNIFEHAVQSNYGNWMSSTDTINHLDSPSTTSQITYKLQFKRTGGGQAINFNHIYAQSEGVGASTLTLMEVLA
tara:strand:+ start:336 stop:848 length:513 start_codon:yes stop_codon:yes gene_type:complete